MTNNAYGQKVEARTERWKAQLDELKARMKEASADARLELQNKIRALRMRLHDM